MTTTTTKPRATDTGRFITAEEAHIRDLLEPVETDIRIYEGQIALLATVPEMEAQRLQMVAEVGFLRERCRILAAGFEPTTVNLKWHAGLAFRPRRYGLEIGPLRLFRYELGKDRRMFKQAMPRVAIEAFARARDLGLFSPYFTVHSADASLFTAPRPTSADPVLIGWHPRPGSNEDSFAWMLGIFIDNEPENVNRRIWLESMTRMADPYLLALWDMERDIAAAFRR